MPDPVSTPQPSPPLSSTPRTRLRRYPERGRTERSQLHQILDAGLFCHLGVADEGGPRVIPTLYGRVGDTLYFHGSPASTTLRAAQRDLPVCITVTLVEGLVLARSVFHHSANFRCAMVFGRARLVTDPDERIAGLRACAAQLVPGRWGVARVPSREELARTAVMAVSLEEASVKVREGGPNDTDEDQTLEVWAGVLPLETRWGTPRPDPAMASGIPVPDHLERLVGRPVYQPRGPAEAS